MILIVGKEEVRTTEGTKINNSFQMSIIDWSISLDGFGSPFELTPFANEIGWWSEVLKGKNTAHFWESLL